MSDKSPSIQEWRDLYDAAREFKKIECWNWMWDSDIFGVQNPVSGEIGYCCVMGKLGEHFALAVYLGTEGLEGYSKVQLEEVDPYSIDALHVQKCLMASFEDREFLRKEDLQVIKRLGLKFRGPNSWPLFRNYWPGYFPWYLTSEEAKYLTIALHQTIDVALRFKNDPEMLTPPAENQYLVRVPEKEKGGLRWRDEWLEPYPLEKEEIIAKPIEVNRLEKIKKTIFRRRGVWEIDFSYFPQPVGDKEERPYYPYVIFYVDHDSYHILNSRLEKPAKYISEFAEQFVKFVEKTKSLPQEILVKRKEVFKLLKPVTSGLGIGLRNVKRLPALEQAQASMFDFFEKQK
jgi:hypothetical protein